MSRHACQRRSVVRPKQTRESLGPDPATAPSKVTVAAVNRILKELGFPLIRQADVAPLRAA